jgi:hypothetical protein
MSSEERFDVRRSRLPMSITKSKSALRSSTPCKLISTIFVKSMRVEINEIHFDDHCSLKSTSSVSILCKTVGLFLLHSTTKKDIQETPDFD